MISLPLLKSRPVAIAMAGGFAFTVGFYGLVFLLSLYLQQERGLTPLQTGLAFVPITGLSAFVNLLTPRLTIRFGPRIPIALGQFLIAAGLLGLCVFLSAPVWLLALISMPIGVGGALAMPTITALLLNNVPPERAGMAGGALNTFRQVGGAVAIAVFGALVGQQAGFVHGMRVSLIIASVLLLIVALASFLLAPGPEGTEVSDELAHAEAMV
jgi:DHA2 family methylenomycin A resistance protein-like MFS transporter